MSATQLAILAISPAFGGPLTRPYRLILHRWSATRFAVHRLYIDPFGGMDEGHYFDEADYALAVKNWLQRVSYEMTRNASCFLHIELDAEADPSRVN